MDITLPQIAEIRQHGRVAAVALLTHEGGRFTAVNGRGKALKLPPQRVLCFTGVTVSGDAQQAVRDIEIYEHRADGEVADVELEPLWAEVNPRWTSVAPLELARVRFPDAGEREAALMMRVAAADGLWFKLGAGVIDIRTPAQVEELVAARRATRRAERLLAEMTRWLSGQQEELPAGGEAMLEQLRQFAATRGQPSAREPGAAQMKAAGFEPTPAATFARLVELGVFGEHQNLLLIDQGFDGGFPAEVLEEAQQLCRAGFEPTGRQDLSGQTVVSIDDPGTTEVDDALSLESLGEGGWRVGIHLAEPGTLLAPGGLVDRDAASRQTTLYLPEGRRTMLPSVLAEDAASLLVGALRPAITVFFQLDDEGHIGARQIQRSMVRVSRAITYREVDQALSEGRESDLSTLCRLASALTRQRLAAGALDTLLPDVQPRLDEAGKLELRVSTPDSPSRRMVAEWMVQANHAAALRAVELQIPMPYRNQYLSSPLPTELDPTDRYQVYRATRSLGKTRVDVTPQRHHGLALDCYTQITSPLRRYMDLLAQRQLLAGIDGHGVLEAKKLERLIGDAQAIVSRARAVTQGTREYWLMVWLQGHIGEELDGLVMRIQRRRVRLFLPAVGMLVGFKPARELEPGMTIRVRVVEANARAGKLKLDEVGPPADG